MSPTTPQRKARHRACREAAAGRLPTDSPQSIRQKAVAGFFLEQAKFGEVIARDTVRYYQRLQRFLKHPTKRNQESAERMRTAVIRMLHQMKDMAI